MYLATDYGPSYGPRPDFQTVTRSYADYLYSFEGLTPCHLYATRIILAIYSIMMIIAASQIITIINKSHHEINSIIRFYCTCP